MRNEPRTWLGVITEPGRQLTMTVAMGLLIVASTVLSVRFPKIGSWLFVATGLLATTWYARMMKRWRTARSNAEAVPPKSDLLSGGAIVKQQTRRALVSIGFVGAAVIVLAIVLAIAEGYISDAEHTTGNLAPAALTGLLGACLMLVGFGSILFRKE